MSVIWQENIYSATKHRPLSILYYFGGRKWFTGVDFVIYNGLYAASYRYSNVKYIICLISPQNSPISTEQIPDISIEC